MKKVGTFFLPQEPDMGTAYRLTPHEGDSLFYRERTDRNIGWITREEQEFLRTKVVGIAGCGGMGGLVASILLRLGIGEVRIADNETFDVSNLNRQFGANLTTIGKSKAFETARLLRQIADDTTIEVYAMGINEESVSYFVKGCDLIADEIELLAVAPRILLHEVASLCNVPLLNSPTVGHRVYLFNFTPHSMQMSEVLGMSYNEAVILQEKMRDHTATKAEVERVVNAVTSFAAPEIPEYSADREKYSTVAEIKRRLLEEGKASIIGSNPPMAAGFLANHILFQLLKDSPLKRIFVLPPLMPGYLSFDAALLTTQAVQGIWW
ncbi:MAG: ThiF family adenylyltransferase [Patescibacteria group bacterium]